MLTEKEHGPGTVTSEGKRCSTIGKEQPLLELATVFFSLPAMGARTSPKENRGWAKQSRPKEV